MTIGVGVQPTNANINNKLTALALQMRDVVQGAAYLSKQINSTGDVAAYLAAAGYGTAENPDNPGGVSDAALAAQLITALEQIVALSTGQATLGTATDFTSTLAILWNAQ
jgi:hypothetical protein